MNSELCLAIGVLIMDKFRVVSDVSSRDVNAFWSVIMALIIFLCGMIIGRSSVSGPVVAQDHPAFGRFGTPRWARPENAVSEQQPAASPNLATISHAR